MPQRSAVHATRRAPRATGRDAGATRASQKKAVEAGVSPAWRAQRAFVAARREMVALVQMDGVSERMPATGLPDTVRREIAGVLGEAATARVAWVFGLVSSAVDAPIDLAAIPEAVVQRWTGNRPEPFAARIKWWRQHIGRFTPGTVQLDRGGYVAIGGVDAKNRSWQFRCWVEAAEPHRIVLYFFDREVAPGIEIRLARPEEFAEAARVEASTRVQHEDGSTLGFDRTASYADTLALHEDSVLYVAVAGDRIIAVDPLVFYPVRLAGRDTKLVCRHNTCVATDFQGQGLMFALAAAVSVYPVLETDAEAMITYVDPANFRVTSWSWVPVWKPRVLRARLPCAALAAAPAGRGARAADAAHIAALVNRAHTREELFRPWDIERVRWRTSRIASYALRDWRISARAAIGVWRCDERESEREAGGAVSERRMAVVLDYGFEPGGGERELEQLLRGACADLAAEGYTHLGIASSAPSCAAPMLRGLADGIDEYLFQCAIPEPPAAAEHGIYAEVTDL